MNYLKLMLKDKLSKYNFENSSLKEDKDIIDRFIDYYLGPSKSKINIFKKNIKYILQKYEQFNNILNISTGKKVKLKI